MALGRIITKSSHIKTFGFVNVTNRVEIDSEQPTLIIGKALAKSICGDKVRVLNRQIDDNLFWTFGEMENRNIYESSIQEFNDMMKKRIETSVKYRYFDLLTATFRQSVNFVKYLYGKEPKYFYISNDNIYMYSKNTIVGFSLNDIDYLGISKQKVIKRIKNNIANVVVENDNFMSYFEKKYFTNSKLLYPYLYFLKQKG